MKKQILYYAIISLITISLSSCWYERGSGVYVTETRNVGNFHKITVEHGIDVVVKQGEQNVEVTVDDNLIPYLKTEVSNNVLKIYWDKTGAVADADPKVYVSAPVITSLKAYHASDLKVEGTIRNAEEITLLTASAASIEGAFDAPNINIDASNGSEIEAAGRSRNISVKASSGSEVEAEDLLAERAHVSASSGASIKVFSSVEIEGKASSGGMVKYTGKPENINVHTSSGGVIKQY